MRAMVSSQCRCCDAPCTRGTRGGWAGDGSESGVTGGRGMGGSTSSCTLRSDEVGSAACWSGRAVASMGSSDAGAAPYCPFLLHSPVVWVVDVGWWVQEPAGYVFLGAVAVFLSEATLVLPPFCCGNVFADA
jgi:hypothetical protein